jgi:hypothetical protein
MSCENCEIMKLQNEALRKLLEDIAADIEFGDLKDPHGDAKAILPDIYKLTRAVSVNRVESNDFGRYPCCNGANGYHALSCRPPQVAEKRVDVADGCGCFCGGHPLCHCSCHKEVHK